MTEGLGLRSGGPSGVSDRVRTSDFSHSSDSVSTEAYKPTGRLHPVMPRTPREGRAYIIPIVPSNRLDLCSVKPPEMRRGRCKEQSAIEPFHEPCPKDKSLSGRFNEILERTDIRPFKVTGIVWFGKGVALLCGSFRRRPSRCEASMELPSSSARPFGRNAILVCEHRSSKKSDRTVVIGDDAHEAGRMS